MKHKARELLAKSVSILEKNLEKNFWPLLVIEKYIVAYKRAIVYEFDVKERALDIGEDDPAKEWWSARSLRVETRQAGADKMETLVEARARDRNFGEDRVRKDKYMITVLERLRIGHWCFIAERNGEILGYVWVAFGDLYDNTMKRRIILREGEAMMYDGYVTSPHRGERLFPRILQQGLTALREISSEKAYTMVEDYNKPSRRTVERLGGEAKGTIIYLKILTMSRILKTPDSSILDLKYNTITFTDETRALSTKHAEQNRFEGIK